MLAETVAVTSTPTTIRQLIATARGVAITAIPNSCLGIMFKYPKASSAVITLTDAAYGGRPASATGVTVLDATNEDLVASSMEAFDITQPLLSASVAGPISVEVIVLQKS
jgi:hypothetical protein